MGIFDVISDCGLSHILKKYGLQKEFKSGKIKCAGCGVVISKDNLAVIKFEEGKPKFICTNPACA